MTSSRKSYLPGSATAPRRELWSALLLLAGATGAACADDPPMSLRYRLTAGPTQTCPAACDSVQMACSSVVSIRVVDPATPDTSLLSVCDAISRGSSLCEMARVQLPTDRPLPRKRLAVQVALYNASDIPEVNGRLACPRQTFDGNRFAAPGEARPAVAGMGYYTPGEDETVVELGCADLSVVNTPVCRNEDRVHVTSSLVSFDTRTHVTESTDALLEVGTPVARGTGFSMSSSDTSRLTLEPSSGPVRAWSADWSTDSMETGAPKVACLSVLERAPETTPSLTCKPLAPGATTLDLPGVLLRRGQLQAVLTALGETSFPTDGLVVGVVVDRGGLAQEGVRVVPSFGSVRYLDRNVLVDGATTKSGIFVSRDAPFHSAWSAAGTSGGYGGRVAGHVTVVLLQPQAP